MNSEVPRLFENLSKLASLFMRHHTIKCYRGCKEKKDVWQNSKSRQTQIQLNVHKSNHRRFLFCFVLFGKSVCQFLIFKGKLLSDYFSPRGFTIINNQRETISKLKNELFETQGSPMFWLLHVRRRISLTIYLIV